MLAVRLAVVSLAVAACAWFGLGVVQAHDENRATALIDQTGTPSAALTARIMGLLDSAATLNPDRTIDILRAQAQTRAGRSDAGLATAERITRAEPRNVNAWVVLGFAAGQVAPRVARLAQAKLSELAPPVPAAP